MLTRESRPPIGHTIVLGQQQVVRRGGLARVAKLERMVGTFCGRRQQPVIDDVDFDLFEVWIGFTEGLLQLECEILQGSRSPGKSDIGANSEKSSAAVTKVVSPSTLTSTGEAAGILGPSESCSSGSVALRFGHTGTGQFKRKPANVTRIYVLERNPVVGLARS